jgi:hypothetical protein
MKAMTGFYIPAEAVGIPPEIACQNENLVKRLNGKKSTIVIDKTLFNYTI